MCNQIEKFGDEEDAGLPIAKQWMTNTVSADYLLSTLRLVVWVASRTESCLNIYAQLLPLVNLTVSEYTDYTLQVGGSSS